MTERKNLGVKGIRDGNLLCPSQLRWLGVLLFFLLPAPSRRKFSPSEAVSVRFSDRIKQVCVTGVCKYVCAPGRVKISLSSTSLKLFISSARRTWAAWFPDKLALLNILLLDLFPFIEHVKANIKTRHRVYLSGVFIVYLLNNVFLLVSRLRILFSFSANLYLWEHNWNMNILYIFSYCSHSALRNFYWCFFTD